MRPGEGLHLGDERGQRHGIELLTGSLESVKRTRGASQQVSSKDSLHEQAREVTWTFHSMNSPKLARLGLDLGLLVIATAVLNASLCFSGPFEGSGESGFKEGDHHWRSVLQRLFPPSQQCSFRDLA